MATAETLAKPGMTLWSWLMLPWEALGRSGVAGWLAPQAAVRVVHPDGSESLWRGDLRQNSHARNLRSAGFVAVELPESERLEYTVRLPEMAAEDLGRALRLDVQAASPFEPGDLAWGHRRMGVEGSQEVHRVVLASRSRVRQCLEALSVASDGPEAAEVWAIVGDGLPLVLDGFGEKRRLLRAACGRRASVGLLVLAVLVASAMALTPTVRLELEARQARAALAELESRLAPVLAQREALSRILERQEALRAQMEDRVEPLAVLDLLTQAIGDDSWVQRLQVQGARVLLAGQSPNAAALMNRLSGHPMVRDVRAPVPATRSSNGRENFQIEFNLAPAALRPTAGAPAMSSSAPAVLASAASAAASAPGR